MVTTVEVVQVEGDRGFHPRRGEALLVVTVGLFHWKIVVLGGSISLRIDQSLQIELCH